VLKTLSQVSKVLGLAVVVILALSIPRCSAPQGEKIELRKGEEARIRIDASTRRATVTTREVDKDRAGTGTGGKNDGATARTESISFASARSLDVVVTENGTVSLQPVYAGVGRELGVGVFAGDRVRYGVTLQGLYYKRVSLGASISADKALTSWRVGGILLYRLPQPALSNVDLLLGVDQKGELFAGMNVRLGSW
jgi:hypothetical protein